MNCGNVFWLTSPASTSTNAMVAALSASGRAPNTASMAPGPTSFSRATAFCVAAPVGSFEDRISVTSRSARKFVKKLIHLSVVETPCTPPARPRDQSRGCKRTRIYPGPAPRYGGRGSKKKSAQPPDRVDYATALTGATARCLMRLSWIYPVADMTAEPSVDAVRAALDAYLDPYLQDTLGSAQAVREVRAAGARFTARLALGFPVGGYQAQLTAALSGQLAAAGITAPLTVDLESDIRAHAVQRNLNPLGEIRNIVAVAYGKGGVGKSTVAVNLALAWAAQGARVGVLDADIYGPSQALMLGLAGQRPLSSDGKRLSPLVSHGVSAMSIGFLVDAEQPMVWRGPMVTQGLTQLLEQTQWGALDYLVVDMPPGTGDIQLTLAQRVPVAGAVIVTTPQDIALADARKGLKMFEKVAVPVLGIV